MAADHFFEGLQIDERWRADVHAIRHYRAVADDVVADFAFGRFDGVIDLSRRRLQHFTYFTENRAGRNVFDGLQADQARLAHLFYANEIPVIGVAGGAHGNFKFVL